MVHFKDRKYLSSCSVVFLLLVVNCKYVQHLPHKLGVYSILFVDFEVDHIGTLRLSALERDALKVSLQDQVESFVKLLSQSSLFQVR